ncbi:MAG: endonuclease domain-containing protein, partial [Caulobacteraceae bacterium]
MRENEKRSRVFAKQLRKAMPRSEALLWSHIRRRAVSGVRFRRQHPIGPYIADFACVAATLVVEVDGYTHWSPNELAHDAERTKYLNANGWKVLRVTSADVYDSMDGVWLSISAHRPPPAPGGAPPPP